MRISNISLFALFLLIMFPRSSSADGNFLIKVDLNSRKLILFENGEEKISYPIAIPRAAPKTIPIIGEVAGVEKNPCWRPTESTRLYYQKKKNIELPEFLKPGDPRNAMGKGKIIIIFKTPDVNNVIRIHGTNDDKSIGQKVTRGCIRMHNNDILSLIEVIKGKKVSVEIS